MTMTHDFKAQLTEAIENAIKEECRILAFDAFTFDGEDIKKIIAEMQNMGYEPETEFDSDFIMYAITF